MRWLAYVLVVGLAAVASAQVPRVLSYQGILTDSQGRILPDGAYQLTIRLYDRVDADEPIYVEEQRVEAVRGVVNVLIGTVEPLPWRLTFDRVYYVGISVNGSEELRPRTMLTAVPYALRSESAAVADVARTLAPEALKGVSVQATPTGPAGGDLSGTYPNPYIGNSKVTTLKIASSAVTTDKLAPGAVTAPKLNQMGAATGEYLRWNGSQWDPSPVSTDAWALTGNAISGTHFLGTTNAQPLVIRTSNTERLRITSSGNVGIGTTSPSNLLHIVGSSDPVRVQGLSTDNTIDNILVVDTNGVMKIRTATSLSGSLGWSLTGNGSTNPANNFLGTTDAVDLVVRTNNTERLRVSSSGFVGIGTSSPSATLDVNGSARMTGNLSVNGDATLGTSSSNQLTVNAQVASDLIPTTTNTYDLGITSLRWRNGWFAGTVTAGGLTLDGFTSGSVLFVGSGGALSENNATFFWDDVNMRLGIGTNAPTARLHVAGTGRFDGQLTVTTGGAAITGNSTVTGTLGVSSDVGVGGNLTVQGNTTLGDAPSDNVTFTARVNSNILPSADATYDLGSSSLRWKDGWFSGTVTSQNATVTSLMPGSVVFAGTGGALSQNNANFFWDNTNTRLGIGTNTPSAKLDVRPTASQRGVAIRAAASPTDNLLRIEDNSGNPRVRVDQNFDLFINNGSSDIGVWKNTGNVGIGTSTPAELLHVAGNTRIDGNTQLGDATTDNVTFTARVNSDILPSTDAAYDLGSSSLRWKDGWFSGMVTSQNATVTSLLPGSVVFAGSGGALSQNNANFFWDNTNTRLGIGTAAPAATLHVVGTATISSNASVGGNVTVNGNTTLGDATSDNVTFTARVNSNIDPATDASYDLGSSSLRWKDGWFSGTVTGQNATVTSLLPGSVVFAGSGGALSQNNANFFWDNTNTRLGIGTAAPAATLHVVGTATISSNASVGGNVTVNGNTTLGDATSDNVTFTARVNSNIDPSADASYDLGSSSLRWKDGWFSGTVTGQNATVTSLLPGSVVFAGSGGALSQNNANFFWDNTNTRLGIGTNAPAVALDVVGAAAISSNASVGGNLSVSGSGTIGAGLTVSSGGAAITGNSTVSGTLGVSSNVNVGGNISVTGNATLSGATVAVPNIPASSTATDVVVWNSNNLERRPANGLISTYAWMLGGNAITNPATEWIGTSSAQPFVVRAGGTQTLQFNTNGSIQRDNGGNTRGTNAIDLQISRSSASQVASGSAAVIVGGTNNTASGVQSFVGAGDNNTASQQYAAVVAGISNSASGAQSFVGGGQSNQANGSYSTVAGGQGNVAQGQYSAIPGGFNMKVGDRSFGFSGQTSGTTTDLSGSSQIAAFVDVDLWLYNVRNQASQLRIYEPSGSGINYTAFQAQAQSSDIVYTLPATAGSPGQVLSIASVSGTDVTLQWSSALLHGTVVVDPPNISANTSATLTITINGVDTGDRVFLTPPSDFEDELIFQGAAVTAPNTVTIKIRNVSGGTVDGGALDWNYLVIKP